MKHSTVTFATSNLNQMNRQMKSKVITAGLVLACTTANLQAQDIKVNEPNGKAIVQVFGNFHTGFGANNDDRGFDLDRSYLGYEYNLGKGVSVKGVVDFGKPSNIDDYHHIAYLKNAQVTWKKDNLTLSGGLISTTQFNFQEKFWGYRYIMKSFQDEYKFGSSADLGISVAYRFADWISADAIVVNGEGYKKIQVNDGLNYGLGLTFTPVKGLHIRLYGGLNEGSTDDVKDIVNYAAFIGYKNDSFRIGAEYNYMQNSGNKADADQSGLSVYGAVQLAKWANIYSRYDMPFSKNDWNKEKEESALIVGAEFIPYKYVKIAPNFRLGMPKADGARENYAAYINFYFGI